VFLDPIKFRKVQIEKLPGGKDEEEETCLRFRKRMDKGDWDLCLWGGCVRLKGEGWETVRKKNGNGWINACG
jgi:hypothetical protein